MGVVTESESEVVRHLNGAEGPVSSLLFQGFKTYETAKQKVSDSKRLSTVVPAIDFVENTFSKANEYSPVKVDRVVGALDSGVDTAMKYGNDTKETVVSTAAAVSAKPIELKNSALTTIHTQLGKLIKEDEAESKEVSPEEMGLTVIMDDVSTISSQSAQKILDVSEKYVEKYLHEEKEDEDEESLTEEEKAKSATTRAYVLSKVVSKRMQRRVYAGLNHLQLRTKEVVHIDLVKYSEMLDARKQQVAAGYDYAKDVAVSNFETRVAVPTKKVTAAVGDKAVEAKEVAEKYGKIVANKVVAIKVPFTDKDILYYVNTAGEITDKRVVKPVEEIIETFKHDLEVEKKKRDSEKPLTIEAGFRALLAALRYRTSVVINHARNYGQAEEPEAAPEEDEEDEEESEEE
mmetsp:Transcript_8766/g.10483  ORF Transcript_8766/g.10483 Transcript_8766/m.10483 type:complete len:404 (-) Transcript_8766:68-1279(-)